MHLLKTLKNILTCFLAPLVLFLFHLFMVYTFDIYYVWPDFDIPMHFAGGLTMGLAGFSLFLLAQKNKWLRIKNTWVLLFLIVAFVVLMAVLWEFAEFTSDVFFKTWMQMSLRDTMLDMFLGMMGGTLMTALLLLKNK